jgi:serine/threonine-protein kinase
VVLQDLVTGQRTVVAEDATYGRYVPTGHILYSTTSGRIYAVPFDVERGEPTGTRFVVETAVRVGYGMGAAWYAVSEAGTFVFVRGSDYENHRFVWLNREGEEIGQVGPPMTSEGGAISPDGRSIAAFVAQPGTADIYAIDTETGRLTRLTLEPEVEDNPVWSPDGLWIAYHWTSGAEAHEIRIKEIGSSAPPRTIYSVSGSWLYPSSWSSTGWVAFRQAHPERRMDSYVVHVDSAGGAIPVAVTEASEGGGTFSPDGRWLLYGSTETGRSEIYLVTFPGLRGKRQVTQGGGTGPRFSLSSEDFFYSERGMLMSAEVSTTGDSFVWTDPLPLFRGGILDVAPDGERFLARRGNPDALSREIHVVVNWFERLKELERR